MGRMDEIIHEYDNTLLQIEAVSKVADFPIYNTYF